MQEINLHNTLLSNSEIKIQQINQQLFLFVRKHLFIYMPSYGGFMIKLNNDLCSLSL